MADLLILFAAGTATAFATGLGAVPVALMGERAVAIRPLLWGIAAGVMSVASVVGLILPALDQGGLPDTAAGIAAGAVFFFVTARTLSHHHPLVHGRDGPQLRLSALVFVVLAVHSLPEGLAIGTAYASQTAGLGVFVIAAIAIQNIPEGTGMAIPMAGAGFSGRQQFWAAVATSAPQPIGAVAAYLLVEQVDGLLPASFGFAAGAMLLLVVLEMLPQAAAGKRPAAAATGFVGGGLIMLALALLLGI